MAATVVHIIEISNKLEWVKWEEGIRKRDNIVILFCNDDDGGDIHYDNDEEQITSIIRRL